MIHFRHRPLRTKLIAIIMSASFFAIVIGLAIFMVYDLMTIRNDIKKNADLNAAIIEGYSVVPLIFDYHDEATQVLAKLQAIPTALDACLYDLEGKIFAEYHQSDKMFVFPEPANRITEFSGGYLHVFHDVSLDGKTYGKLYIRLSAGAVKEKFVNKILVIIGLIIALLFPIYLIAIRLQKYVSRPILDLAEATQHISQTQDFRMKLEHQANDEIGFLYKQFNNLLTELLNRELERDQAVRDISFLAEVLKNINENISITDVDDKLIFVNQSLIKTYGYSEDELIGQHISVLRSENNSTDVIQGILPATLKGGWQGELMNRKKDGTEFPIWLFTTIIFDHDNKPAAFVGISTDITERKKAEKELILHRDHLEELVKTRTAELENFFNVALDLLCIADTSGHFIRINKAWSELLGYAQSELEGKMILDFVHEDDYQISREKLETLKEQETVQEFINRFRAQDGTYLSIEWHIVAVGETVYAAARDITARIKTEDELRNARFEADQANIAKSEFLSRMSHELRTPMNAILGFAQLLEMGELNAKQTKGVNHILLSGRHLLDLINEVLDISRIESGRLSLSLEPVQISKLVYEIKDILQPLATNRNIRILHNGREDIFVRADKQRLKQVLINLINNAIKYNNEGGSITINAYEVVSDQITGSIRIDITDTGPGIAAELIDKLFKPFERIGADSTSTEGTGLGLAVVKKLMDAMGGKLGVISQVGQGSTFWIEFPNTESQKEMAGLQKGFLSSDLPIITSKGTILYIEDNISNIELVEQILVSQGSQIQLVTEMFGKNAVYKALECEPELILLDLNLPDIHGSEVLELILANSKTREIPVVIISADAMPHQLENMIKSGAKEYLTKPLDVKSFLKVVGKFF
ncbi:MAG: PAS domain S-box protein [Bacteroidales bacterium]